jgi:hypothetical protein
MQINQDDIIAIAAGLMLLGGAYYKGWHDGVKWQAQAQQLMMLYVLHPNLFGVAEDVSKYRFITKWGKPVRIGLARRVSIGKWGFSTDLDRTFQVHVHVGRSSAYIGTETLRNPSVHLWGGANITESKTGRLSTQNKEATEWTLEI